MFYEDMNTYYKQKGHTDNFYMVGEVLSEYNEVQKLTQKGFIKEERIKEEKYQYIDE